MLECTPRNLWEEATAAIEWQKRRLAAMRKMVEAYQTPWHRGGENAEVGARGKFESRNHAFEYIALNLAMTVFDNPRWQVTARRGYAAEVLAPAYQAALDRWTKNVKLQKTLAKQYVDFCFTHCVGLLTHERAKSTADANAQIMLPHYRRIGPDRAFRDTRVFEREDCRFEGHIFIRDKADLLADPAWNRNAVKRIPAGSGVADVRGEDSLEGNADRGEIAIIEIHVPEHELPDSDPFWADVDESERGHYRGTIFTLPLQGPAGGVRDEGPAGWLAPPRPLYGADSPYVFGGCYPVPDDPLPLSMLVAVQGQNLQNNAAARAVWEAIVEYKKLIMTSSRDPSLAMLVKKAKHGHVLPANLQDLTRMLAQIEVGGPTASLLESADFTQRGVDRSSGLLEAERGSVTGATAYETSLAAAGSSARSAWPKRQFSEFTGEIGRGAAKYFHCDDQVVLDLDGGAGLFLGGRPSAHADMLLRVLAERGVPEEIAIGYIEFADQQWKSVPFEAFDFSVQPLSTERASDPSNRARMAAVIPMVVEMAQLAPVMPWLNVKELLGWIGQAFDMPDLARVIDPRAAMMSQMMGGTGATQPGSGGPAGAPRVSSDVTINAGQKAPHQRALPQPAGRQPGGATQRAPGARKPAVKQATTVKDSG